MRLSCAIASAHAPREFSDEIRRDARPAERADGDADRAAFRLIEIRQTLVEIDVPTPLAAHGVFSWKIASGGHASEQTRQLTQKTAAPKALRTSANRGALVSTRASRKFEPNPR